jgi:hypothetical protein
MGVLLGLDGSSNGALKTRETTNKTTVKKTADKNSA